MELNVDPFDILVFEADRHPVTLRKVEGPLVGRLGLQTLGGELLADEVLAETLEAVAIDGLSRSVHHKAAGIDGSQISLFTQIAAQDDHLLCGLFILVGERSAVGHANGNSRIDPVQAQLIVEGIDAAVIAIQASDGRMIFANEQAARLHGFRNARELVASDPKRLLSRYEVRDENDHPFAPEDMPQRHALRGKTVPPTQMKWRLRGLPGEFRWSMVRSTPVFGADGRVDFAMTISYDITEKKQREERLQFQSAVLEAQIEASPEGVLVVSDKGVVLKANRRFREIWGFGPAEFGAKDDDALLEGAKSQVRDPEGFIARVRELYSSGEGTATDEILLKDGRILKRYCTLLRLPGPGDRARLMGRIWFFCDVTAARRAEERERVLEVERATRSAAEQAQRKALFLAEVSRLLSQSLELRPTMNALAQALAGHFNAWAVLDVVCDDGAVHRAASAPASGSAELARLLERHAPPDAGALLDGRFADGEPEVVRGLPGFLSDPARRLPWLISALPDEEQEALGALQLGGYLALPIPTRERFVGALTLGFVNGRCAEEDHLAELAQRIAERLGMAVENTQLYARVREALELRESFLTIASHELRTPVATLQLLTQGMLHSAEKPGAAPLPPRIGPKLHSIERQCRRLGVLIGRLMDVTRMMAGPVELNRAPMDLSQVTRDVLDAFYDELAAAGCVVTLHADRSITGSWDRARIEEIISSLVSNAALYGHGQPVEVKVGTEAGRAFVEVEDHGIGVPTEAVERIFGRFERAVDPISHTGFGLGLFVARHLVEAMGGTIVLKETSERGSTFRFELPLNGLEASDTRAQGSALQH